MNARRAVALALALTGCAAGANDDPNGRGDGAVARDAAAFDGGSIDAGEVLDAGPAMDASAPDAGRDAGPRDAGARDAGARDAGRDAGRACAEGAMRSCTSSCGSAGVSTCVGGAFGACIPPDETCDRRDDDCDGATDEGFRATVERVSYAADLAPRIPTCDGRSIARRAGPDCHAAIARTCEAGACATSGFGPVENSGDALDVVCVVADVVATTYTALSAIQPGCTATSVAGLECNSAIHRFCDARAGMVTGFGPTEHEGDALYVACLRNATVVSTTYTALRARHAGCDGTTQRLGLDCNAAIQRTCVARGFVGGFGPIENEGDTAFIACVSP